MRLLAVYPALAGGLLKEADIKKYAVAITEAAHPTAKKAALLKYSEPKREGVLLIKMELEYYGAASNNRYTADALVEIQVPKKSTDPYEITRIDFVDNNNSIRPNEKNLKKLMDDMNSRFRIEKAK